MIIHVVVLSASRYPHGEVHTIIHKIQEVEDKFAEIGIEPPETFFLLLLPIHEYLGTPR